MYPDDIQSNYIVNISALNIDMTAPVITKVEPGTCLNPAQPCPDLETMCFYLPKDHQDNTPVPNNPQVTVTTLPEMTVYVR